MRWKMIPVLALGVFLFTDLPVYAHKRPYAGECKAAIRNPGLYLKGSKESLMRQNRYADEDELAKIEDNRELQRFIGEGLLIRVPKRTKTYELDPKEVKEENEYAKPWAKTFIEIISEMYSAETGKPLIVTGLVRSKEYHDQLRKTNSNAASTEGSAATVHTTGAAVDFSKLHMNSKEKLWLQRKLAELECRGAIEATEEHYQQAFHVFVRKRYLLLR